jgi:hypothetical protein
VQEQVEAIRDSGNMTSEQQTAALQAIQIETQVSVGKLLGDEGFSSYSSQRGGNWLNNIAPGSN